MEWISVHTLTSTGDNTQPDSFIRERKVSFGRIYANYVLEMPPASAEPLLAHAISMAEVDYY